jgi:hypothetical protein
MAIDENQLNADFKSYLHGEEPSESVLSNAPRLQEWSVAAPSAPAGHRMTLVGLVTGHPYQPDGRTIETSELVWLDRKGRWARTMSRIYALGKSTGTEIPIEGIDS